MKNILTADIGGTNSRFGHFAVDSNNILSLVESCWFKTLESKSFTELFHKFAKVFPSIDLKAIDAVVISIAGPVEGGSFCSPPLIEWDISLDEVKKGTGIERSFLINDFVAQAYACFSPIGKEAEIVLAGERSDDERFAVVGAGTSLGKATLVSLGKGSFIVVPSEGAHSSFPFDTKDEAGFQEFLLKETDENHITAKTVVSGTGIGYIHKYLTGEDKSPEEITSDLSANSETLIWASRFLGRVCRNYILETVATGGLYIVGGISAKIPSLVKSKAFELEFYKFSSMEALLKRTPVYLVANEESGLWGAAYFCIQSQLPKMTTNANV